jgi:hypothetical protein
MNSFKLALGAGLLAAALGAQAAAAVTPLNLISQGSIAAGGQVSATFTVDSFKSGLGFFSANIDDGQDLYAGDVFQIFKTGTTTPVAGGANGSSPFFSQVTFNNLATGSYYAVLKSGVAGTYSIETNYSVTASTAGPVPEPESLALALAGLGVVAFLLRGATRA